jgi:3-deoxy-D-manno-octulosonic-acid transferase
MARDPRRPSAGERCARWAYSALWIVATPLIAAYLLWRARRQPAYRRHWPERFLGRYRPKRTGPSIWVHAVSVGETRAAAPLIDALTAGHPGLDVVVTHMTPTGRDTALALFGDRVRHAYLAYDYPFAVAAFLRHWRPRVGVVMETEIWPNLMAAAARASVPMVLANARLSPKSLVAARRWAALMRPAARSFAHILAQTDADARRFAILTDSENDEASSIATVGNVKFDSDVPQAQRARAAIFRRWIAEARRDGEHPPRVVLCASTREGEEELIVDAWTTHARDDDAAATDGPVLLVLVPRHPQRFDAVVAMVKARGLVVARRSEDRPLPRATQVWIGDSMGELWAYYLAADLAYIGGSVVPLGGQNLIEAAAAGCPILIGRHTFNFAVASDEAVRSGAALRVGDFDALAITALQLAHDGARRRRMREAGVAFAAAHRGATARTVAIIDGIVGKQDRP